ncbi:hypothetical protein RSal33209_2567 [Renibacterium salmoninarum ATCC 33209]|uniref:Uncharacterized protein n=1 Tax=Renibacterium salmoninarum (strain ATCC 33209 / DSM 20767 / JCM 11484 / NBRC 15589 / NCIMB 2235) TaxID=288705 RepID=A9WRL1_RENSM|nr:hypothetical protein RSal33209_2567 [Renibacterium salmoninarum ATCC 33209]
MDKIQHFSILGPFVHRGQFASLVLGRRYPYPRFWRYNKPGSFLQIMDFLVVRSIGLILLLRNRRENYRKVDPNEERPNKNDRRWRGSNLLIGYDGRCARIASI